MKRYQTLLIPLIALITIHGLPAGASTEASLQYNPARWSPLAPYIMQDGLQGPDSISAYDDKGNLVEKARLEYDTRGRLVKEIFFDAEGKRQGFNAYEYEAGNPVAQKLYNNKEELISSEIRVYAAGNLQSIVYQDGKGQRILTHSFKYSPGKVHGAEISADTQDGFVLQVKAGQIQSIQFTSSTGEELAHMEFKYDGQGKLVERIRKSPGAVERCRHIYDSAGRLTSYIYEVQSGKKWVQTRKITLEYGSPA